METHFNYILHLKQKYPNKKLPFVRSSVETAEKLNSCTVRSRVETAVKLNSCTVRSREESAEIVGHL